jgi:hypothetical protein
MKLFKNKYRIRIEDKIKELESESESMIYEKESDRFYLKNQKRYCELSVKINDIALIINVLKSLL